MAREIKDLCWAAVALAAEYVIILRIKEFLIIASFAFIATQGNRDLPKGVNSELRKPPDRSFLTQQCKFWGVNQ